MDFKEFVNKLEQDLKEALSDISPGAQVRQTPVEKLQAGSYTGISITPVDTNIGMNLNADQLFAQMQEGRSYEGVLAAAVSQAERGLHDMPSVDVQSITNYETAKNLLCFEVVGTEQNADMLANIPHTDVENMSMVYRLQLDSNEHGASTVLITNAMMEQYGVTKEQLHADAMENAPEIRPASFKTMAEVMAEMMGMPVEMMPQDMAPPMYVATNEDKVQGAAVMFYPDFMDQAAKELGGDVFVLPSSVHEVLILPDDGSMSVDELRDMVTTINAKELGKQLKKIGMLVVQDQVWGRVTANRSAGKATRYYMDEFHLLLKEEQTAAYSVEIWKRFRKWGGIPTGITQNVKDLLSSREVQNIFENSDFIIMLNQASGDRQILASQLNISPHQLSYVTQSGEGEGLLFYGNVILPFVDHFPTDLELYRIMTTKLSEVQEAKEA